MGTVLVVDDSWELLDVFSYVLKHTEFDCKLAKSKRELYMTLECNAPKVIFLDVLLGGEDGRGICKQIKLDSQFNKVKIILMSACPTKLINYDMHLADDILEKPFNIDQIQTKIEELLR